MSHDAARELRAESVINAPVERVWDVLADVGRMSEWSPELVRMVPLKRGGLRVGQWYLGINRRRAAVWPTRSVVTEVVPRERLAWLTTSSGATWIWELSDRGDGTTGVIHRRPVARSLTLASRVVAPLLLGGSAEHADELEQGMATTIARLGAAVE